MAVAIGIVVYRNDAEQLARCLRGMVRQSAASQVSAIALHDNDDGASAGAIAEALAAAEPDAPVVRSASSNCGFGAAHNRLQRAVYAAHPDVAGYLCLNPDGLLHPRGLERLIAAAGARSWRGIFEAAQFPVPHPKMYDTRTGATAWCSGCCLLIPRLVWDKVGGFDPRFFMYCEDVDLSWRVKAWGGGCYTVADALIGHYVGDREGNDGPGDMYLLRSACLLAHKWHSDAFAEGAARDLHARWGVNADPKEIAAGHERVPPSDVPRAAPNFNHGLYFSRAYW